VVVVVVGISQGPRVELPERWETMEWIERGEMSDKGLDLIRNRGPVRTLKFNFGVDVLLGKGDGIVATKRGMVAEESVGDDYCTMSVFFVNVCMCKLLVGGMDDFYSVKR